MSTISASTTSTTAYKVTADTTGTLVLQTGSTPTTAVTIGTDQSVTTAGTINGLTVGRGAGAVSTNTAVGASALAGSNSGTGRNVAIGLSAMAANTSGQDNTAVGWQAMLSNTTGTTNTAVGRNALVTNTTGSSNTGIGLDALALNTTASNNTAVGYQAGYTNTTSAYNVFIGWKAGYSHDFAGNGTNTFIGEEAGTSVTSGRLNTFIGGYSGGLMTTGTKNTIIGSFNGNAGGLDIRTSSNYIVLSDGDGNPRAYWAGADAVFKGFLQLNVNATTSLYLLNTGVNGGSSSGVTGLYIGDSGSGCNFIERAKTSVNTTQMKLYSEHGYNVQALWAIGYNTVAYQGNNSTTWSTTSDSRVKTNVRPIGNALEKICALNGVHFEYKNALGKTKTSFIAQEFEQVLPGHVHEVPAPDDLKQYVGEDGMMKALDPELIPYLVEAIKELKAEIDTLKGQP